ncbi:radical SAM protein [Elusimicrobiota bacterium]
MHFTQMISINKIEQYVSKKYGHFGPNKSREIIRLLFEITKRDKCSIADIRLFPKTSDFAKIKIELLKKRYPKYFNHNNSSFYLPKLKVEPALKAHTKTRKIYPREVFVEKTVRESELTKQMQGFFPKAKFSYIDSLKTLLKTQGFSLEKYNSRAERFFVAKETHDFFKACPCTTNVLPCGFNIINLGFGCPYECSYCFLQGYQNFPGIIFPANVEDFFKNFKIHTLKSFIFPYARIGSGEFTDSLVFDNITNFSTRIIDFMSGYQDIYFEFKTKSKNIENFLDAKPQKNIVVSWSLNPQKIISENEFCTTSLEERLISASECAKLGYGVGFHFDPIIHYSSWENDYKNVVNQIFSKIPDKSIKWISLGTLRMPAELKKVIESRFPDNELLDAELLLGKDHKLRYHEAVRTDIYKKMNSWIKEQSKKPIVYLCMETKEIWNRSQMVY